MILKIRPQAGFLFPIYDSRNEDQSISGNWVFKLGFKGSKLIEIYNDDWRDYTEYFNVSLDGKELFHIKTDDYETLEKALAALKSKILALL